MFLFRFFGLALLEDRIFEIKYHKKLRIINVLWIFINLTVFIFLIISPSTRIFTRNYSHVSEIIELVDYVFALATVIVVFVHVQMVNTKDLIWHDKLRQLDRLLHNRFGVIINHRDIGRGTFWKVLITFTGSVACSAINVYFYATFNETYIPLYYVQFYYLKTIINLRYIQNFTRIDFIKHRIQAVYNAIQKVVEQNSVDWKIVLVVDKANRKHQNMGKKFDDVDDILIFKRFYATLFETMKLLENCFGWSLLAQVSFTFIDITFNLYWFFVALLSLDDKIRVVDCIFDIIPAVVTFSCLVHSSFDSNKKAKELINMTSKLYTNTTSCYNKMVKEFLLQIHHEKIENSANDFFIIDFQLLSSVGMTIFFYQITFENFSRC